MAAVAPNQEPLHVRIDQFRAWEPEPDMSVGMILTHFFHLWRKAEGGRVANLVSAERLCTFLPPAWEELGRFLLNEMVEEDEPGPILFDFRGYIYTLLTRWLYPPDFLHPLAVEAEVLGFAFPNPPNDPVMPAGQPARSPSPPLSPPRTPSLSPPPFTVTVLHEDPYAEPYMPLYDSYGIHEQGYVDPLSPLLVQSTPATDVPSSPTASYRRTARMSTTTPTEVFTFTYFLDHLGRPYLPSDYLEGSSDDYSTSTSEGSRGNGWYSTTDSEDD